MLAVALFLLQSQADIERAQRMLPAVFLAGAIFGLIAIVVVIIPFWFICRKAGMSPWLSLLWFVPFGGLILCYVLAFADWNVVPAPQTGYVPPAPYSPPPLALRAL